MPTLFCLSSPSVNPSNGKALSLPLLNPIDRHGRVFFFSWFSFFCSFLAWYSLPPLLTRTIRLDLGLTENEVLNSNIVALVAGLLVRLIAGPLCDAFGPRLVMVGILWVSAIPCGLAGTINTPMELYALRFFIGIAGAAFVPAQVWVTSWYDSEVVGTATAFAGGWGDAGVGMTFFVMPALFEFITTQHSETISWRLSFIFPALLLVVTGMGCLFLCDDTPNGPWKSLAQIRQDEQDFEVQEKEKKLSMELDTYQYRNNVENPEGTRIQVQQVQEVHEASDPNTRRNSTCSIASSITVTSDTFPPRNHDKIDNSPAPIVRLGFREGLPNLFCLQTIMLCLPYFVTFGGALIVNSVLASWYLDKFAGWDQTRAGQWSAMFGLLNFITRPLGGILSDVIYRHLGPTRGLQGKVYWCSLLVVMQGVFCLWIGILDPTSPVTLLVGVAALAVFMEAGNGACYAIVPFVKPEINGLMGGSVGAAGNLGGILFSTIFRFVSISMGIWIVGIFSIVLGLAMLLINPVPKCNRKPAGELV